MNLIKKLVPDKIKVKIKRILQDKQPRINPLGKIAFCNCCGSKSLLYQPKLWDQLIKEWGLSDEEVNYINRQQGIRCKRCKANLRTMAIAYGIMRFEKYQGLFIDFIKKRKIKRKQILEINNAGWLTQYLEKLPRHTFCSYPEVDIQNLPYQDASYDIVVHSDTLEHVQDPILALEECKRVLKPDGYLIFTVPIVLGRISKSRDGLPPSHHGSEIENGDDYIVYTEVGADVWRYALEAGFSEVRIYFLEYPASQSILCKK